MAIFDRPTSYRAAQAREEVRGTEFDIGQRQDEAAYRVASLFFDADQAARSLAAVGLQLESLTRVRDLTAVRVSEGRELPIESRKADLKVLQAQQRQAELADSLADTETSLAQVLGFNPGDRVQPAQEERQVTGQLDSEESAIQQALDSNREIRRLESNLQAKNLEDQELQSGAPSQGQSGRPVLAAFEVQQLREVLRRVPAPQLRAGRLLRRFRFWSAAALRPTSRRRKSISTRSAPRSARPAAASPPTCSMPTAKSRARNRRKSSRGPTSTWRATSFRSTSLATTKDK